MEGRELYSPRKTQPVAAYTINRLSDRYDGLGKMGELRRAKRWPPPTRSRRGTKDGVSEGIRTPDPQGHNLVL